MFKLAPFIACFLLWSAAAPGLTASDSAPGPPAQSQAQSKPESPAPLQSDKGKSQEPSPPEKGAASAAASNPVTEALTSQTSGIPAQPHRVQMRLSGSTCLACLHELQVKVARIQGVSKVKIDFPADNVYDYLSMPSTATAAATVVYDASRINLDNIKAVFKTLGYHPYKVVDKSGT